MRPPLVLPLLVLLAGCAPGSAGVEVSEARIGAPTGPHAALYFSLLTSEDDRLVGASTEVAERVELHETSIAADGTTTMAEVDSFPITASRPLVLEPGGRHLMLVEASRLEVGAEVEVELQLARAGPIAIRARVVDPAETLGDASGGPGPASAEVARASGCLSCHTDTSGPAGPSLNGLAGSEVRLADGTTVVADEEYLRRAIVDPGAELAEGYGDTMPRLDLTEEEISLLVDYIEGLGS